MSTVACEKQIKAQAMHYNQNDNHMELQSLYIIWSGFGFFPQFSFINYYAIVTLIYCFAALFGLFFAFKSLGKMSSIDTQK